MKQMGEEDVRDDLINLVDLIDLVDLLLIVPFPRSSEEHVIQGEGWARTLLRTAASTNCMPII